MLEYRRVCIPMEHLCNVQYYVEAEPVVDPHFMPEPPFVVDNKFFDTRKEAEDFKKTCDGFCIYTIRELVTPL